MEESKDADPAPVFDPRLRDVERQSSFKPSVNIPVGMKSLPAEKKLGRKPDFQYMQHNPRTEEETFRAAGPAIDFPLPKLPPMPSTAPPEIKTARSSGFFSGGLQVKLRGAAPGPKMGEFCPVTSEPLIKPPPLMPDRKPIDVMGSEVMTLLENRQEPMQLPPSQMRHTPASVRPAVPPAPMSQVRPPAPAFEEPKPGVSIERMVFLERVERIMASEARIKEIEAENKTLVGMVARLNKELEELKAKLAARS